MDAPSTGLAGSAPVLSRSALARATLEVADTPDAAAAVGVGDQLGEEGAPAGGSIARIGTSFTSRALFCAVLFALVGGLVAFIKKRRRKDRRRAKAVLLRGILASDDEDDDVDAPLLGLGSTRYRGSNSGSNLSHIPGFDLLRKEFPA